MPRQTPGRKDFYIWQLSCAETERIEPATLVATCRYDYTVAVDQQPDDEDDHVPAATDPARIATAKKRLLDLLDEQHALVKPEAITRLAETYFKGDTKNIDPHVTGQAIDELVREGDIVVTAAQRTRGGRSVRTIQLADDTGRATAIDKAARRKRLLYARYLGWATGSNRYPRGLIGPAGETAVRRAIIESAALQPENPGAGEVSKILNVRLPGPADSGGYMTPIVAGIPTATVTVLIEIKSIREWIYPTSSELYQLLYKAMLLKRYNPTVPVVPILVCRRAHPTAFYMAKQLGFLVIEMRAQFLGDTLAEDEVNEVRNELGFTDLYRSAGPSLPVRDRLSKHLPPVIVQFADTWTATTGDSDICDVLTQLNRRISGHERKFVVNDLRNAHAAIGGSGGW